MITIADVQPQIEKALSLAGNTHSVEDLADALRDGRAKLWAHDRGIIVTEVVQFPQATTLNVWLAAGELDGVLALTEDMYEWAKQKGCVRLTMLGRKGWEKVLADHDWVASGLVEYRKEL